MPTYIVTKKAYFNKRLIGPGTRFPTITVDKPFPKKGKGRPSWLGDVVPDKTESKVEKAKREEKEKEVADQDEQNRQAVEAISFAKPPKPSTSGPAVETL